MTQNEKDILLKDLCARLPYGVVIQEKCVEHDKTFLPNKEVDRLVNVDVHADSLMTNCGSLYYIDEVKPYLFPISSMTDEQKKEYAHILVYTSSFEMIQITGESTYDWLNKNMFDWRGLIPMGLAIDATNLNIY
jgi:hypothetical protein